ncbi:MAG TPA: lasso peptide biosynthesis B2 protein [Dongiaceae bacterium]|nr:lasso peptide biosynthesis B2 protein [Dongiaceae bacterium]
MAGPTNQGRLACSAPRVVAAAGIRHAVVDGAVVILDLRRGTYHVLDRVASAMWDPLVRGAGDDDDVLRTILAQFAVDANRARRDLAAFRERCLADGLLAVRTTGEPPPAYQRPVAPKRVVWPAFAAWRCLAGTALLLRRGGFATAYRVSTSLAPAPRGAAADGALDRALAAFARAENFFVPRRAPDDCLPRSLALFRFLRMMGLPAEHVIGCRRAPFFAHAWVECGGRVVLDDDHRAELTALARAA